ncbi:hypothetical protein O181_039638 [Austropuccinia psidii MF-1]|uniref:Mediator of RNA polymerase II transcription subunit 17 n=1 Tax=Austropuccinia psidii MF-1 TaxID=1389203 RepID=A0A9Q3DDS6_9BASI|nr:hypothetical protein [Austropuccinia psidii MF-1]
MVLSISVEPPATRRLFNEFPADRNTLEALKDVLWDFNDDGTQVWKEREDDAAELSKNLRRVWEERGDFSQLTIENIEKQAKQKIDGLESRSDTEAEGSALQPSPTINPANSLTVDELWEMRMKMAHQLGIIGGELSTGLDLLNILLGPLAPEAVDTDNLPLPPGGIAPILHSSDYLPPQPHPITLIDSGVCLMRKQQATQNAANVLKRAATELSEEAKRSQQQWDTLLNLREAGWNMRPKGVKPGTDVSLMSKGAERAAREIGIAFATTEAAEALRASSFASLECLNAEKGQTSMRFSLKFPPRPRRRLVISLELSDTQIEYFSPWCQSPMYENGPSFDADLELAQAEVLEEEIFGEISKEARLLTAYPTTTSDSAVVVKGFGPKAEIRFDMLERAGGSKPSRGSSPNAKLVSSIIRLLMVAVYRFRRRSAIGVTTTTMHYSQPPILVPTLDLIVFYMCTSNLRKLLFRARSDLKSTKLPIDVEFNPISESVSEIITFLGAADEAHSPAMGIGGMATLRINGRRSVTLTISCPAVISLWLKDKPLTIAPERLYEVLIDEIDQCIIRLLFEALEGPDIDVRKLPSGLVCKSNQFHLILAPKFRFGDGVIITIENLCTTLDHVSKPMLVENFTGQTGIQRWAEELKAFMVT